MNMPLTPKEEEIVKEIITLADKLDTQFTIPGIGWRIGLDSIIGLIPTIGDAATALISLHIIRRASQLGVPLTTRIHMGWNIFIDWLVGLIPIVGDLCDIAYKSNTKNCKLLLKSVEKRRGVIAHSLKEAQSTHM